ncbi:MAG: phosphoadenosine phosphosulfate reductase family protein [Planctomycetes bacterium]|nr:phosphoadenosine phosphosulfate reductase family protein [Planctomycetota bacterium]
MAVDKEMLEKKLNDTKKIIRQAFEKYPLNDLAVAWTGGKDSTVMLWIIREVCREDGIDLPKCFCIDEGDMFQEIRDFITKYTDEWHLTLEMVHNHDVSLAAGGHLGATVKVADLNERNRAEIARLGYDEDEFDYEPESYVGNHLMKTVAMNVYLEDKKVKAFFEGIRWDEQQARSEETYFSPREASEYGPAHERISPMLHFRERDIWDAIFAYDIPYCKLYARGFRSLGARVTTGKADEAPAWEQDLENTSERGGRRQDKEGVMKKLRELGYM